jgi:hypothetical protein
MWYLYVNCHLGVPCDAYTILYILLALAGNINEFVILQLSRYDLQRGAFGLGTCQKPIETLIK